MPVDAQGERLQKVLAHAGVASRRASEALITAGRVRVNGVPVTELGTRVGPGDAITVDGRRVGPAQKHVYFALNKPTGYVSTARDPEGRPTVLDLVRTQQRVYPIGRLDWDSEGLLLLSNDGELTHALTHPSHEIEKTYDVSVRGAISDSDLARLSTGIQLVDGKTAPAQVKLLDRSADRSRFLLTIHEGRNRQVRRMCDAVGHPVGRLRRIRVGPISLGRLPKGQTRTLTGAEIGALRAAADVRK